MASLLTRTVAGENVWRYAIGDIVCVVPDDHVWGRAEDRRVWVAEGKAAADWPGGFAVVELTGLAVADAQKYLAEGDAIRRTWTLDHLSLERRAAAGGRDTLRTAGWIKRAWSDADVPAAFKLKA